MVGTLKSGDQQAAAPIVRRMLRHNAIEAWTHMQKTGWKRC